MAPMMFPSVQHYMSRMAMGIGMAQPSMPSIHNSMQLPRVPIVDQSVSVTPMPNQPMICQPQIFNPMNYQNQMQNPALQEQYARLMGFHHMQPASQVRDQVVLLVCSKTVTARTYQNLFCFAAHKCLQILSPISFAESNSSSTWPCWRTYD